MQELLDAQKEARYPSPLKVGALMGVVGVFMVILRVSGAIASLIRNVEALSFIREDWAVFLLFSFPIIFGVIYMVFFGNPINLYGTMFVTGLVSYEFIAFSIFFGFIFTKEFVRTESWLMILAFPFIIQLGLVLVAMFAFVVWLFFGLGRQVSIFRNRLKAIELNRKN